jgi:hypothetical protein
MRKNPFYAALSLVLRNTGRSLQILKYGLIENGWVLFTDLEHEIKVFVGDQPKQPVLVDVGLFIKTGDLPAAIGAAQSLDVKDFPGEMTPGNQEVEISPKVLERLVDLLPAVSTDDSRGCLKCVLVNRRKKEAVATNGHFLLSRRLSIVPKESFLIDGISLRVAACFGGNFTRFTVCHKASGKDATGKSSTESIYLILSGDGWQLISKSLPAGEYPYYAKILPDRSKATSVLWDNALKAEICSFVEKSKPFVNPKSHLVYFTAQEGIVRNKDLSYLRNTVFTRDILALRPEQVIGVNGEILQTVLEFLQNKPVSVTVGSQMIEPIVFQGQDCLALIMPLRTGESNKGITRSELMQEEKGADDGQGEMKEAA